ncbi:MAG: amidohydrolase family protein [Rhodothermales bacterium]
MYSFRGILRGAAFCAALVWLGGMPDEAYAQKNSPDIPVVSNVVAIENARIVQGPARVLQSGTVVFRDGVITAVGRRVDVPYDAHVIDGDSLTVYAGFIDALSHTGIPEPRNQGQPESVPDRSNPPFDRAGITPEASARTALDLDHGDLEKLRNVGFTTIMVAPRGRMLPGQATMALSAGTNSSEMILQGMQPMFFQFTGAQGVYPGTPMAIMSKFRQLYREADRRMRLEAMYAEDPSGLARPPYDAVHEAFFPVVAGDRHVLVWTDEVLEIHRAMTLQEELGFSMILTGLEGGIDTVDKVAGSGLPVALTLDLPDQPRFAAKLKADSLQHILDSYDDETRTATFRDVEAEKENLEARQLWSRSRYVGMAALYENAGIPFAFTTMGVSAGDVHGNLREMIEAGLSREAALAALTVNAAALFGASDRMGSIDTGKMANLIVTDGDVFDEDTSIKMVFVAGQMHEPSNTSSGNRSRDRAEASTSNQ